MGDPSVTTWQNGLVTGPLSGSLGHEARIVVLRHEPAHVSVELGLGHGS